ncbi:MAG: cytochrome B [Sphingobacteriales bacterium]|nr:cytochrome B [Sphingobacteriales bacterium]
MYPGLLFFHSFIRYIVLLLLVLVIIFSFHGFIRKRSYLKADRFLLTFLTSFSHLQLTLGIILYFISPWVIFNADTMKNQMFRYWTVEHLLMMLLAVVFISIPGLSVKRLKNNLQQHRRTFIWTSLSLLFIITTIVLSQRPFFSLPV